MGKNHVIKMKYYNKKELEEEGFTGFNSISDLISDSSVIPNARGVYLVLYLKNEPVKFITPGSGGHFKGKDPNVPIKYLHEKWVDNSLVVYIGKAGKDGSISTLRSRIRQYLKFGQGKNTGHWGGRFIWQIKDHNDLVICWKVLENEDPRIYEYTLIQQFIYRYYMKPFANLID